MFVRGADRLNLEMPTYGTCSQLWTVISSAPSIPDWVDTIDAAKRILTKQLYRGTLYNKFEPEIIGGLCCFGSRANSGMIFEAAHLIDVWTTWEFARLLVFFTDCSFCGKHTSYHLIY